MTAFRIRGVVLPEGIERELWIRDGKISDIPIAGAETVLDGGWIVPGLVDAHCHPGLDDRGFADAADREAYRQHARADLAAGVTLIRDCGSMVDTSWMAAEDGLPTIIRSGRHIAQDKRYAKGIYIHTDPDALPDRVEQEARSGDGWVKIVGDWIDRDRGDLAPLWTREQLDEAMRRAHQVGARVTAHSFSEEALPDLIESGIDCIEHGTGITAPIIERMLEHGTALVPTVINIHNFPSFADAGVKYPVYAAHMTDLFERHVERLGAAYAAGVPIYAGTDAGGSIAHGRIADEVQALRGIGLSALDALGAASWRAREWLGHPGLDDGASADLVCYNADPLADLSVLHDPAAVILRGAVVTAQKSAQ